MIKLDLGCGNAPKEGFKGVDISENSKAEYVFDLVRNAWPFENDSIDELYCNHFIEHIPLSLGNPLNVSKDPFFYFFDEAYRVAKPGCKFYLQWPYYKSPRAFQDPTHRRFIPVETMMYLDREWRIKNGLFHYEVFCNWKLQDDTSIGHYNGMYGIEDSFAKLVKA